jgi:hypothetical protein
MIKKYNFLFVLLFSLIISREALSENSIIECSSFEGSQISSNGRNIKNADDGYSGQTIKIHIKTGEVEWTGPSNNFKVRLNGSYASESEGWIVFIQKHPQVFRTYTFFLKSNQMAFTETQTQIMTGLPNIKSFIGNCSVY